MAHKESDFLGKVKRDAQNVAERHNLIWRHIRADKERIFTYPDDKREDRICVETDNGVVTSVKFC